MTRHKKSIAPVDSQREETALDDVDGDLTASIAVTGSVNTAAAGSYPLTYSATDLAGNTGSASRLVTVVATSTTP